MTDTNNKEPQITAEIVQNRLRDLLYNPATTLGFTKAEQVALAQAYLRQAAELKQLRAERGWQDISTAPKHGTIIGAWKNGKWYAAELWWDDSVEEWTDTTSDCYCTPTHWMATPDQLTDSAQSGEGE